MKEKKANILLQYFFKLTKIDCIVLGQTAHYRLDPNNHTMALRRHEVKHALQWYKYQWKMPFIYIGYLVIYGYKDHPLELEAHAFARQMEAAKSLSLKTAVMSDDEYIQYIYKEAKIQPRNT